MRHVLLITVGLAPQVVTETVYALRHERAIQLDEIHLWTTLRGKEAIEAKLLAGGAGALYSLYHRLGDPLPKVYVRVFGSPADVPQGIRVPPGAGLDDFTTTEANELAADTLARSVQEITADPDSRLYCSLSGARKTLGPFLALALQFFGRKGDLLFHVLVPPELESDREFFYPRTPDEAKEVRLFEVPVPLMRDRISPVLETAGEPFRYSEFVRQLDEELGRLERRPQVVLTRDCHVAVHNRTARLTPLQFALYAIILERRQRCQDDCAGCERCSVTRDEIGDGLAPQLERMLARLPVRDSRLESLDRWRKEKSGYQDRLDAFRQTVSKINQAFRTSLGVYASICEVRRAGPRNDARWYCTSLSPKDICLNLGVELSLSTINVGRSS